MQWSPAREWAFHLPLKRAVTALLLCLLTAYSAISLAQSIAADATVDEVDVELELNKLIRYEQRIQRLEATIDSLHKELDAGFRAIAPL